MTQPLRPMHPRPNVAPQAPSPASAPAPTQQAPSPAPQGLRPGAPVGQGLPRTAPGAVPGRPMHDPLGSSFLSDVDGLPGQGFPTHIGAEAMLRLRLDEASQQSNRDGNQTVIRFVFTILEDLQDPETPSRLSMGALNGVQQMRDVRVGEQMQILFTSKNWDVYKNEVAKAVAGLASITRVEERFNEAGEDLLPYWLDQIKAGALNGSVYDIGFGPRLTNKGKTVTAINYGPYLGSYEGLKAAGHFA